MLSPLKRLTTNWPELNEGFAFKDYIKSKHAGLSLLQYYTSMYPASGNAAEWAQRIDAAQVSVNGVTVQDTQHVLRVGDLVSYARLPWHEPDAPSYVDILYEDDDMVAVCKPPGLQVLPAAMFQSHTVLGLLRCHYGTSKGGSGSPDRQQQQMQERQMQPLQEKMQEQQMQEQHAATAAVEAADDPQEASATGHTAVAAVEANAQQPQEAAACHHAVAVPPCGGGGDGGGGHCNRQGRRGCRSKQQGLSHGEEDGRVGGGVADERKRDDSVVVRRGRGRARGHMFAVPAPVHRLGRGTSGLLLCARTPEARRRLTELMSIKTAVAVAAAAHTTIAAASGRDGNITTTLSPQSASTAAADGSTRLSPTIPSAPDNSAPQELPLRKIYRALVQGLVGEDKGRVDVPIGPIPHPGVEGGLFAASPDGKPAASIWTVLEHRPPHLTQQPATPAAAMAEGAGVAAAEGKAAATALEGAATPTAATAEEKPVAGMTVAEGEAGAGRVYGSQSDVALKDQAAGQTLMQVEILTGRPHQIRIHMAALGHPLVGDPLYGVGGRPRAELGPAGAAVATDGAGECSPDGAVKSEDSHEGGYGRPGDCGYHLHATELQLPHPITGQPLLLRAPPPPLLMTAAERATCGRAGAGVDEGGREGEGSCKMQVVVLQMNE